MVAAGRPGGAPIVKLLLAHGANPNPTSNPSAESSPLLEASLAGDADIMQALLDHGADFKDIAGFALANAAGADCTKCIDLLVARNLDAMQYTIALQAVAVLDNPESDSADAPARRRRECPRSDGPHGADVRRGVRPASVEQMKMLIEKKADVNAKSQHPRSGDTGLTALDLAKLHGDTAVVDLLLKSGATSGVPAASVQPASMRRGNTIQAAVPSSLPLLQRTDASFVPKAGMLFLPQPEPGSHGCRRWRARTDSAVDEQTSARQVKVNAGALGGVRDLLHQGFFIPGINASPAILAYVLLGLDAEGYQPDLSTDAVAMFIQTHQMADGHWAFGPEARPPLCANALGQTVVSMRSLQLYTPRVDKAALRKIDSACGHVDRRIPAEDELRPGLAVTGPGLGRQEQRRHPPGSTRTAGGAALRRWVARHSFDGERRVHYRPGDDGAAEFRSAGFRPGIPAGRSVPAEHATGGWVVARAFARRGIPAIFRQRIPAWRRPMDLGRGHAAWRRLP